MLVVTRHDLGWKERGKWVAARLIRTFEITNRCLITWEGRPRCGVSSEGRCDAILNFFIPPFREGRMNRRVLSRSRAGIVGSDRRLHVVKMAKLEAVGSELAGKGEMEGRVRETGPSKFFHFAEDTYTCFSLETSTSLDF